MPDADAPTRKLPVREAAAFLGLSESWLTAVGLFQAGSPCGP